MFATNDVGGRVDEPAQCGRKPCSTCWRVQRGVPYQIRAAVYPGSRWCQRQTSVQALALPRPRSVLSIPSSSSQLDGWRAIHDRGLRHVRELSAKYVCVGRGCGHRLTAYALPSISGRIPQLSGMVLRCLTSIVCRTWCTSLTPLRSWECSRVEPHRYSSTASAAAILRVLTSAHEHRATTRCATSLDKQRPLQ